MEKRPEDFLVKLQFKDEGGRIGISYYKVFLHPEDMVGVEGDDSYENDKDMLKKVAAWAYNLGYEKAGGS